MPRPLAPFAAPAILIVAGLLALIALAPLGSVPAAAALTVSFCGALLGVWRAAQAVDAALSAYDPTAR